MKGYCLKLINYDLIYSLNYPTKITDFDYDPSNPNRRFVSTLLHSLSIYDKFNDIELLNIKFSTDTCYKIKYGLTKIIDDNIINKPIFLTISDVYINDMNTPSVMALSKLNEEAIKISILNNINNNHIAFYNMEIPKIIKMLEYEI